MKFIFKKNLPNLLSLFRLVSILPLTYLGFLRLKVLFLILYSLSGFTDLLDGYLARKLKAESDLGRRLDSLADNLFIPFSFLWLYFFKIEEFEKILIPFLLLGIYATLIQAISLLRFKKLEAFHLWSLKILMLPTVAFIFYIILAGKIPLLLFYLIIFLGFIGHTEKLLILLISKEKFDESITSIFQLKNINKNNK